MESLVLLSENKELSRCVCYSNHWYNTHKKGYVSTPAPIWVFSVVIEHINRGLYEIETDAELTDPGPL